jgi:hypothetical protein
MLLSQYEFCWICMGNWTEHGAGSGGYYKCNKYDGKAGSALDDAARAKVRLTVHAYMSVQAKLRSGATAKRCDHSTALAVEAMFSAVKQHTSSGASCTAATAAATVEALYSFCKRAVLSV